MNTQRGDGLDPAHAHATRFEKCSDVGCSGGRPTHPNALPLCDARPSRSMTCSPASRNARSARVLPTPVRPPTMHTLGPRGGDASNSFSFAVSSSSCSSPPSARASSFPASPGSSAAGVQRDSTHRRNALYPPRITRTSTPRSASDRRRNHATLDDRIPPRQQCTYTAVVAPPLSPSPPSRSRIFFLSSTNALAVAMMSSSFGRVAFMPRTIATPLPCFANAIPTFARSSSVNSGIDVAPGMCPRAYSPGDRTSRTMSPRRAARTTSSTDASARLIVRRTPAANASMDVS
mmetsp:Transcript_10762/g.38966  ORF Transcript_10762/g.38966 Transcript_10762/m.38966 type:complete len:290 (+) Transcript_10762:599-1468(+)